MQFKNPIHVEALPLCIMNTSRAQKTALNRKHFERVSREWHLSGNTREEDKVIFLSKCSFKKLVESFVLLLQAGGSQAVPAYGFHSWQAWRMTHKAFHGYTLPKAFFPFLLDPDIKLPVLFGVIHLFSLFFLLSLTVRHYHFQVQLFLATPVMSK